MKGKRTMNSFWVSYSDLMTSLFFIMLVLFLVCIIKMKVTQNELFRVLGETKVSRDQYAKMLNLDNHFKKLSESSTLRYDEANHTFIATDLEGKELFEPNGTIIRQEYLETVDKVGNDLKKLLSELHEYDSTLTYLMLIEGTAANKYDYSLDPDSEYGYELSYKRSLALYNYWTRQKNIDLRKYNTEILICGSGFNGIHRDTVVEENNKRFVIQILPKISRPKEEPQRKSPSF